jgi:transposase
MVNRGGRPGIRVVVSPSERTTLEQWARRRRTGQGLAQRARLILYCAAGRSTAEVAAELGITRQTVGRWRGRVLAKRVAGLVDEPRPGTPRRISDADVEHVIATTLETTPPRRDALVQSHLGETGRVESQHDRAHLACLRVAAASE